MKTSSYLPVVLLVLSAGACERAPILTLTVTGRPPGVATVQATITLGEARGAVFPIEGDSVRVLLPMDTQGLVQADVDGISPAGWRGARGSADAMLAAGQDELAVDVVLKAQTCSVDGWCWEAPLPHGRDYHAVWAAAKDDVWLAGDGPTLFHHDGTQSTEVDGGLAGAPGSILELWGSGPRDVWAAGSWSPPGRSPDAAPQGLLLHFDGARWQRVSLDGIVDSPSFLLTGVGGSAADDVWVTSSIGKVLHFDGRSWTPRDPPEAERGNLGALWVNGKDEVWIINNGLPAPHLLHHTQAGGFAGVTCQLANTDTLRAVWGKGQQAWAGGSSKMGAAQTSLLVHFDGTTCGKVPAGKPRATDLAISALWGTAANDIWAAGFGLEATQEFFSRILLHEDGTGWTAWDPPATAALGVSHADGMGGTAADDIWTAGTGGDALHYDGRTWRAVQPEAGGFGPVIVAGFTVAWGSRPDDVWLAGGASTADRGRGKTVLPAILYHFDGRTATRVSFPSTTPIYGLSGSRQDDVWAVTSGGGIFHYDGAAWSPEPSPTQQDLYGVWHDGAGQVWAVGKGGVILHRGEDAAWRDVPTGKAGQTQDLLRIWGAGQDDFWIVGRGAALRYEKGLWSDVDLGAALGGDAGKVLFEGLSGSGRNNVWMVGKLTNNNNQPEPGRVLRWDGSGLRLQPWPEDRLALRSVWVAGDNDVAAVVSDQIWRWNGSAWRMERAGVSSSLLGLYGTGPGDLWALGNGIILHQRR